MYVPEAFSFWRILKKHIIEMSFGVILLFGIGAVVLLGPDKKAVREMSASMSSIIEDQSPYWREAYPYGYKIIAFTDKNIIHTFFDTLPEDLEINWKDLSVARIQASQIKNTDEKIKITMANINYAPADVSGLTIVTSFSRKKGIRTSLTRLGGLEFVAEIIEDNGQELFCLFGLRGGI